MTGHGRGLSRRAGSGEDTPAAAAEGSPLCLTCADYARSRHQIDTSCRQAHALGLTLGPIGVEEYFADFLAFSER